MEVNTPLGILEFSDLLKNYGYRTIDTKKTLKKLAVQTFNEGKEILWYRNATNQAITEVSCRKDKPRDYEYTCSCGYELRSGFNLESIRCHECGKLMAKSYTAVITKVV